MRREELRLKDMLEHMDAVLRILAGKSRSDFDADPVVLSAVQYMIGEAASHVSKKLRTKYSHVPWQQVCGMRNILAHEYFGVDLDLVWHTATERVPPLRAQIAQILKAEFPDQNPA